MISDVSSRFIFGNLVRPTAPAFVVAVLKNWSQAFLASSLRPHLQHIVSAMSITQVQQALYLL